MFKKILIIICFLTFPVITSAQQVDFSIDREKDALEVLPDPPAPPVGQKPAPTATVPAPTPLDPNARIQTLEMLNRNLTAKVDALERNLNTLLNQTCPEGQFVHGVTAGRLVCVRPIIPIALPQQVTDVTKASCIRKGGRTMVHGSSFSTREGGRRVIYQCQDGQLIDVTPR